MSNVHIDPEAVQEIVGGEYEREPVPAKAQKGPGAFWGMYAGEHAAGAHAHWRRDMTVMWCLRCAWPRIGGAPPRPGVSWMVNVSDGSRSRSYGG